MKFSQLVIVFSISFWLFPDECNGQATAKNNSLQLITSIPLPSVSGRIDHLAFDKKRQLIFVAALGNNSVEVVDLNTKRVIHSIKDVRKPQGVVYIPERNTLVVANGRNGACDFFNGETFQKNLTIQLSGEADNVRYDSVSQKIYVGYGSGGVAIIDAASFKLISDIKLSGHPESFQIDKATNKIYVNVPDLKQIEVIDLEQKSVTAQWKMTEAMSNFPMCLDEINHRLFVGCRYAPKLLIIDTQTGKTVSFLDIDKDVDDIYFDPISKQIYLSCGAGSVFIFKQVNANKYKEIGKTITLSGARTSLLIPELKELIVASPGGVSGNASLLIYNVKY